MAEPRYTEAMKIETKRHITACAVGFALPRYEELPNVGLYLDQTVQYVNSFFRSFPGMELTAAMVSNYVKKDLLSHPVKKKYTRDQLAYLIYIAVAKNVLSMENIQLMFRIQKQTYPASTAYNYFCDELENYLSYVFGLKEEASTIGSDSGDEKFLLRSTIIPAAHKIYLDCCFAALRQEEAFWPDILPDLA